MKFDVGLLQLTVALRKISSSTLYLTPLKIRRLFKPCESEIDYHFNAVSSLITLLIKLHSMRGDYMNYWGPLMMSI